MKKIECRAVNRSGHSESFRYSLSVPELFYGGVRLDKISDFYRQIFDSCLAFCEKKQAEREDSGRLIYCLRCAVTYKNEDIACVLITATLERRTKREGIYLGASRKELDSYCHANIWDVQSERIVPPKVYLGRQDTKTKVKLSSHDSLLLSDKGIYVIEERTGKYIKVEGNSEK